MAENQSEKERQSLAPDRSEGSGAGKRRTIDLRRYFPAYVTQMSNKWARPASFYFRKNFGIGINEWRVMVLLAVEQPISAVRVAEVIGMDKAVVSRSLQTMLDKQLVTVEPDEHDSRRRQIRLTEKGWDLHDRALDVALARQERLLSCLSSDEQETLFELLDRINSNVRTLESM